MLIEAEREGINKGARERVERERGGKKCALERGMCQVYSWSGKKFFSCFS